MAKSITVITLGQSPQIKDVEATTVGELAQELELGDNLQVKVNGATVDYDTPLADYNNVVFGEKIKGGKHAKIIMYTNEFLATCTDWKQLIN